MNIVAQSLSHCGEIVYFCYIRSSGSGYSLYALATTNALPRRLCYLGIVNIGAFATLPLHSWRPGQLQAWFKCPPEVGVALLDSRTTLGGSILV